MRMVDLIIKKRDGFPLEDEEIKYWINGYVNNEIPEYQTSAMLMAIVFSGMNKHEIATLTQTMLHSGELINFDSIKGIKVDKHSTGGVGDKTSLVLGPMLTACGAKLAKLSGRGLGHTGGTLDKLESIPGLTISIDGDDFTKQVNEIGIAIAGQTQNIVPADKKLYALRDVTGTVESIPLIASSIMSKKMAAGTDLICLDVTVGEGAFMKNIDRARSLANEMVEIGKNCNRRTIAIISDMDEPLGFAVGNALEVKEAIDSLNGKGPKDLIDLCYKFGAVMLKESGVFEDEQKALEKLHEVVDNGEALNKLVAMVKAQNGDESYILHPEKFEVSKYCHKIKTKESGFVSKIHALDIGLSAMKLGAGREKIEDKIDMSSGILLKVKVGDEVKKGDILCEAHTNKENVQDVLNEIFNAFELSNNPVPAIEVIKEIIR